MNARQEQALCFVY